VRDEDPDLQRAHREWLAHRPRPVPGSAKAVVEKAERRLVGAIKRAEPLAKLTVSANRVRDAHLRYLRAKDLVVALPTGIDADHDIRRHRTNLSQSIAAWTEATVDEIIAYYKTTVPTK
jgi:hypothetical protein